jgi:hypothetical protein
MITSGQVSRCSSKHFAECSPLMRSAQKACRFPFDGRKLTGNARLRLALSMPARQANCSHLPNVSLLRDMIFAHSKLDKLRQSVNLSPSKDLFRIAQLASCAIST